MDKNFKINQKGLERYFFQDLYYKILKSSWSSFIICSILLYLLINLGFACIYCFSAADILNANEKSLWDYFVFSFQTSSTVGYGYFLPTNTIAHTIVIFDTLIGVFYVALMTGLSFSKLFLSSSKFE